MDALLREAEALKGSLENSSRFLHLMPNEAPKAQNFLNQLNDKIAQLDRSDAKVQAKLPALEAAVLQAAAAIDGASKAKEVDAEIKAIDALLKKAQDAARAVIFVPGSSIRPAEADLKKLADAVAELQPALEVFIAKYGALDKAKAKVPTFQAGLAEAVNKLALASTADQGAEQLKKVVEQLKTTDAQQRHLKGVLFGRISTEKEANDIRRLKDELWTNATELEQHVGVSVPGDTQPKAVVAAAMQTVADADAALNKYQQDGSVETLRVEVASWSSKLQDFINRWHDENAYNVAMEALEHLQGLLPALEQFGDVNGFVTNTLKSAKDNVEKANKNIPLAKARIESKPLVELVRKSRDKLGDFITRPHVENYFNTAMEGLEELASLVPALEAYIADSAVEDLVKSTKAQIAKAEALVAAAKVKFESAPLRDKVASTHAKLNDFINRPHVQSYYNDAVEAMEELKALVPALEVYIADSDVASAVKNAKEKMAKAEDLIVKAGVQFAAEPLKNKVIDTYRKLDPFVNRWHVKEYYDTALEALEELKVLLPELEQYASDSYVASALTNARDMIRKTEAVLPQAKTRFESGPLNDKVTETHRKLDDFINRFHIEEYYNKAVEALEELQQLIPALEAYTSDTYVASNVKNAKEKVLKAEALIPQAKARFESSGVIEKIRSLLGKLSTFTHTWHHKPYFDDAVEATEEIKSLLPVLEQYSSDSYAANMIRNATQAIAEAEAVMPKARARFEGEPLRDKVVATHNRLDKFIKDWYYKEYYNEAIEAIEELNALLPALEAYDSDSYIAGVIQTAKKKIAQAEANIPQAKVKFEAEPLKDQVSKAHGRLDKFIKDWYYKEYYNEAIEALEELNALLPALEVYASDSHVADTIKYAKDKMAKAEANIPQAKVKFEAEPLKDQVNKAQGRLDKFIKDWYYQEYYNEAMEAIEELNALLPALEVYASDTHVAETIKYAKDKIAKAEANVPQAKMKFESAALKDKVSATQGRLDKFIKDWYYKEYYNDAIEALEELNSLLPALEAYAADSHVADTIKHAKEKMAKAEANIPQAKVKFEAEPLKDQVNKAQGRLDKFIKDWYYQEYYNEAMEGIEELNALLPALEVYASDTHVAETIKHARNKIAQAEANVPQAKMKFESAALKDKVSATQGRLDKFIKDWYYQEYYNDAMEALEELNSLLPALEAYAADSHVADVIKNTKTKIAQAEANIPQAKVKFEAEPLKDQVNKTQQLLDKFIKDWYYQEYYNTAVEAIDELNALLPALEVYASDTHVAETIKNARNKIAQAEANIPQAKVKFEAEPLKDQVNKTQGRLDKFIKDWYYQEYYNEAMEALEELSMLLPALEVYASDTHVAETIKHAKDKIAKAEANIPQAKVKFESAALKDQVTQAYSRLNDFIKSWHHKEYYNTAVETIDELNLLLPALETFASDTHVAETIKAAREKIAQAEANIPQAKVKFEAEPLRDKVGTTHAKLDNFIKSWHYKEYYDTAVEAIDELEQLLPALETYASDDQVARTIKTARDKIQAAKANFPQARARFEAEPLRNKVDQLYAKLDNFIKTWQHEEYYNTAMEAMEELETLLPALEEFASDSGVATTLRAAKDRIQKAEANIPQARLKYAAEPLRAGLNKAASQLDNFIKTWHHEEYYNTAIEAIDEVNALISALEPFAADSYVASTISSAKDKVQKAQANFPLAKARFEAKPLQEMVGKSSDKLPNFIKSWHHEEYYNTAMEAIGELEALLPALEVYASDSGVATTIKVAKDRIQAANSVVPQAKLKFEAEPLKQQVGQVAAKLDNFIKSWHHEEYFNTATEALEELKVLVPALEAYAADSHVSSVISNTKEKIAKAQANLPLAKAKYEAEPLRKQVQQHFDKLNRFVSQWWVEECYNAAVESLDELSTLVPRLEAFSDGQAEATARLAREKILAAEAAMKSASLKFQAEPLKKKTEAAVSQLRTASSKWTTQENFEQGLELQQELQTLVKALQPFKEDSATEGVLSSAHQALLAAEERLSQLRVKYHLQPALEDARKTTSTLSTFIAKWLQEEEYRKGVDAVAKAKRLLTKLSQFGANAEAQTTAENLKQKLAEAEQQVKIAQAKHGVIEATPESDDAVSASPAKKGAFTPYQPPKEIPFLLPEPTSFQSLAASLDPPAGLNVGPMKTFVTPLEEQLARALGATVPICFNWENWVNHQSFTSKPDGTKLELIKTLYQNCARQVVGALAQLIGADQVARNLVQANTKRVVLQYDPTDSVLDGRERHNYKAERNRDGDLIVTLNMTQHGQIQLDHGLRVKFDRLYNIAVCQAQAKALVRMKELSDKARLNAYIDIEFAPFGLNEKLQAWDPKDKSKQISRFWDTLIPQGTYATTDASIRGLCQIMKEASPTAREALQRYVRRISFTWDMENRVSDPLESFPSVGWYKIDVQDNNEVLFTVNEDKGSNETFRQELVVKWTAVMAIFTEKYVSEFKLRTFEEKASAFVGKKVEAEINWAPSLRSHPFKILGAKRVETVLRGIHTTQLEYLTEIWKSTSEWTEAGKRILGERIDRVVITLEPTPAAWSLKLNDRTLSITMGYDQATQRRAKLQDEIEWITEATIPIEIEAANRSCAKLTKELSEQAKKPIAVGVNWEAFVTLPEFVGLGHDTVVGYMRNVYAVAANATAGLRTSLTHEIGHKAITAAIDSVLVVLEPKNIAAEPVLSMNGSVMGVAVGYTSASHLGKILARRERVENLLRVIVQVHKALADERYNAVVAALAAGIGRPVPIEADWSLVDTPQFEALLPEQKSYVVECLHACFPECVVAKGVLVTNQHPVGKACYGAKLKRVYFHVAPEGSVDNVLNKDGELHVELDLRSVVGQGVFDGHWQIRGEEAFDALVPIAQYDTVESYNAKVAERIASTVGKAIPFTPNWDFTANPTFQQWKAVHKRQYIMAYCNGLLESIFFGSQGLPQLCALSLVRETIAQKVDAIVAKVDPEAGRGDENGTVAGRPTVEGTTLVLNVSLSASAHSGASWGQKLYRVLQLRPTIIAHFLERHGPPNLKQSSEELTAAATAPLSVEMDLTEVLKSKHVESLVAFHQLVDYLTVLYALPGKIVTGKNGMAWLCTSSPDARAQLVAQAKVVRLVIDTTDSTPPFEGHRYQTNMYQVRVVDGALQVQFNQAMVEKAVQDLGEVAEWELTPAIARRKELARIEEEREQQKQWEKECRRREKEREKERRHRELMSKLH